MHFGRIFELTLGVCYVEHFRNGRFFCWLSLWLFAENKNVFFFFCLVSATNHNSKISNCQKMSRHINRQHVKKSWEVDNPRHVYIIFSGLELVIYETSCRIWVFCVTSCDDVVTTCGIQGLFWGKSFPISPIFPIFLSYFPENHFWKNMAKLGKMEDDFLSPGCNTLTTLCNLWIISCGRNRLWI